MGHGTSKSPAVGVAANPRVGYADDRSKVINKPVLIDAPVLVKLQDGTVRYRYVEAPEDPDDKKKRTEKPHEGPERKKKHGYFFHSRLNDFSEDASYHKEESWKFAYVYKGAERARQKKLYYVFGKGLKTKQQAEEEANYRPQGKGYEWPSVYKQHGHLYFDVSVLPQEGEIDDSDTEDTDVDDTGPDVPPSPAELCVQDTETLSAFKRRLAIRYIKPQGIIHLYHKGSELTRPDLKLGSIRHEVDGTWKRFRIRIQPK